MLCGWGAGPYGGMLRDFCSLRILFCKHLWAKGTLQLAVNSHMCLKLDKYCRVFFFQTETLEEKKIQVKENQKMILFLSVIKT